MAVAEAAPVEHLPENLVFELGIDSRLARELSQLILDDTIELPPSGRGKSENFGIWDKSSLLEYGTWLCHLLDLSPMVPDKPSLKHEHLVRASKLGIGPSPEVLETSWGEKYYTKFLLDLGEKTTHRMFEDVTNEWCIEQGTIWANKISRRPTGLMMNQARRNGKFPGRHFIINRFQTLTNFYEHIGRPNLQGADEFDLEDWGVAFKRQNGPDCKITLPAIDTLSARGTSPSRKLFRSVFPGFDVKEFDSRVNQEYWKQMEEEAQEREAQLDVIGQLCCSDDFFKALIHNTDEEQSLGIAAKYRLIQKFHPTARRKTLTQMIRMPTAAVAGYIISSNDTISHGDLEMAAEDMRTYSTLWPGYRFQNADLKVAA